MIVNDDNNNIDRISEKQIREILKQLEKNRTILTLNLLGKDYERLTIVTGLKKIKDIPYFIIDYPHEFKEKAAEGSNDRIVFEFIGLDKIQYKFRTTAAGMTKNGILVKFPEYIERMQRRKYFRITPPLRTKLLFPWNMQRWALNVINLSVGGVLITQEKRPDKISELNTGDYLSNLLMVCPEKGFKLKVIIEKAVIKRVEHDSETDQTHYGLQFINMDQKESNKLNTFIYSYQREVLRRRYLLDRG
jgi:c-di-GMP-binding flagellar brake protein YcgR